MHEKLDRVAGIVTTVAAVVAGEQAVEIDATGIGSDSPQVVVRWGHITMTYTDAEQAQQVLGIFGLARQALVGGVQVIPLRLAEASQFDFAAMLAVTWRRTPRGSAVRHEAYNAHVRKVVPFVELTIAPITFKILDQRGMESALQALERAHRLAVEVFPDGERYRRNPNTRSWREGHKGALRRKGEEWPLV